mmetsp:Transcript_992/g.2869  ORF Transcript_992/g.2869 Transcript_992/m.2869 type:complete len:226 (-) Transcript_992:957-1634(-)
MRVRLELRMELGGEEEGVHVAEELHDLHALPPLVLPGEHQASFFQAVHTARVHFITMTVSLHDTLLGVIQELRNGRRSILVRIQKRPAGAESHGAAHAGRVDLGHEHHERVAVLAHRELRAGGFLLPQHVACILHHRALQTQTDAEERHPVLARVLHGQDLALHTTVTETPRDQHAVGRLEAGPAVIKVICVGLLGLGLQVAGVNPVNHQLAASGHGSVSQGLDD